MNTGDPISGQESTLGALVHDAEVSLKELIQFEGLRTEQWFVRLSVAGRSSGWELLPMTNDQSEYEGMLADRIGGSEKPVTDLVLAFVGLCEHRRTKGLMAHMEYFRTGHPKSVLCGSHLRETHRSERLEAHGGFLCFGGRPNGQV